MATTIAVRTRKSRKGLSYSMVVFLQCCSSRSFSVLCNIGLLLTGLLGDPMVSLKEILVSCVEVL